MDTARTGAPDTARSYGSARSGGQTARSAFAPSQYSYRSRGSGGGVRLFKLSTLTSILKHLGLLSSCISECETGRSAFASKPVQLPQPWPGNGVSVLHDSIDMHFLHSLIVCLLFLCKPTAGARQLYRCCKV